MGSRVVITTRIQKIANTTGTIEAINLESLAEKDYWEFFVQCAFGSENPEKHPNLEHFGRQIAKKLGGLPLAAKTVGAALKCNLNEEHWKEILESKWWEVDQTSDGIMPVLRLSYDYLLSHLKQCFVYCSLFPKDFQFSEDRLISLWIAQGFIQPDAAKTMEKTGKDYFSKLLSRSFFQSTLLDGYYVIHDLLHDLAKCLSDGESFRAEEPISESRPIESMKKIRHAYISADNLSVFCNDMYVQKHLRSLVVVGHSTISLDILEQLKGLRVLILQNLKRKLCSESFRQMLHLRYLEIIEQGGDEYELPESLCKLYNLQVLHFHSGYWRRGGFLACLPKGINKLIKLRHLIVDGRRKIEGIGTLTSLQELNFHVNQKESGFEMRQLRDMSRLEKLHVYGLESVESKEQASEANLCDKRSLEELTLRWDSQSHVTNNPDGVLEGLEPHQNLKHLVINCYRGKKSPSWWNGNWVSHLTRIVIWGCTDLETLPPMGHLPFLKHLELRGMNGVKRIGPEFYGNNTTRSNSKAFPSLEYLSIKHFPVLIEWCSRVAGLELFPRLSKLTVSFCPNLRGPLCLPSQAQLRGLNIDIRYENSWRSSIHQALNIICPSVSRLKEWVPCQSLASVEELEFRDEDMTSFPGDELEEWFQHFKASLRKLAFDRCRKLQSLPSKLINSLPALQELTLDNCKNIKSLPEEGLPSSLTKLEFGDCSRELAERCEEDGVDWHKISHIPTINIFPKFPKRHGDFDEEENSIASASDSDEEENSTPPASDSS